MLFANCHFHSTFSDDEFTPEELVSRGVAAGFKAMILTDHDTMRGSYFFQRAARQAGVLSLIGCEFTGKHTETTFHIVGVDFNPENEVLRFATSYDYEGFYQNEISLRAAMQFPPFSKIVRVLVSSEDDKKALEALREVYFALEKLYTDNPEKFLFFNKMRSPVKKIQNKYRYQVLMRLVDGSILPKIYDVCAEARTRDALVSVEENPSNMS
jgi:primosomal protein N'